MKEFVAKLKNIITRAVFEKRLDDGKIRVKTGFGRVIEAAEIFPYGICSRAKKGSVTVLCPGGNLDAVQILPVESVEGAPELQDGDFAVYSEGGSFVVCRDDGTVEVNGTQHGGLVKVAELVKQLNANNQFLHTLKNALVTPIPEPGNGSPSAFQAGLNAALSAINLGDFSDIESDKVFHGTGKN